MITIINDNYILLLSFNPCEIFEYYNTKEMHGLNAEDCKKHINNKEQSYIAGWCNLSPINNSPFVFINLNRCTDTIITTSTVFHEMMHLSGIIFNDDWINKEEEMITFAETETLKIVKILYDNYL